MKDENRFIIQNAGWAALHPKEAAATRKAIREHKKKFPYCELTGSDREVQTHHIIPIWADSSKAADPDNLINLSARINIHHMFGHDGNFRTKYVANIREIAKQMFELSNSLEVVERVFEVQSKPKSLIERVYDRFLMWRLR